MQTEINPRPPPEDHLRLMRSLVSQRHFSVYDPLFTKALGEIPWADWQKEDRPFYCLERYLDTFTNWIASTRLNQVEGLESFPSRHLVNGTTQTFDEAYFRHRGKRLRFFRGEYAYHRRVIPDFVFLDDEPLARGDYAIISAPFCSTGSVHPEFFPFLERAAALDVPVTVDCAYFGTCRDFRVRLDHPAIEAVTFSLSKGLGLGDIRSGIRFSRIDDNNPICQQNRYHHSVLATARIGIHLMERFSPDHLQTRFGSIQADVCREIGVKPADCVHLATGGTEWNHFRVDEKYNNLGIRELIRARYKGKV